jgi:hypothetical protein
LNWFKFALRACGNRIARTDPVRAGADHRRCEGDRMNSPLQDDPNEPVPWMQQLLDNPFLLLFLGVLVPMLLYTLWGVVDILTLPVAK